MIYFMADVFASLTYADMFPMVNLVALACGTTTITYRTDGSLEAHYFSDGGMDTNMGVVPLMLEANSNNKKKIRKLQYMRDKKTILFVCQYFYPEVFRGNDIAFHWAEYGHDVHVVTGIPNYPDGVFHKSYGFFKRRHEVVNGVCVTRLPIFPRGNSKIMLMLNYFSYYIVAWVYILFHAIDHKYDFVFVQQLSPVMMSAPGVLYKKLRKVPLYTWVLDLWPESLSAAGGINNKYILGGFKRFVKSEYRHSDKILTSSKSFDQSIMEYGEYRDKIVYFPQWGDGSSTSSVTGITKDNMSLTNILKQKGVDEAKVFDKDSFKVMFAGAVGEAHGMECNLQAALLTKERKDIKWCCLKIALQIRIYLSNFLWTYNFKSSNP